MSTEIDMEAYNRKHGYTPTPGHDDARILRTIRARDEYLLGRFADTYATADHAQEEAAHEEALATAAAARDRREAFLARAGIWADQGAHIAEAAARAFFQNASTNGVG